MDERIITILKEVAQGELCSDDGNSYCYFLDCSAWDTQAQYGSAVHDAHCPVTLARTILSEHGMSIFLYAIVCEFWDGRINTWVPGSSPSYTLAFTDGEVQQRYPEHTDHKVKGVMRRNVSITRLGEAQVILKPKEGSHESYFGTTAVGVAHS